MNDINENLPAGATPIEPEDLQDLIPDHIETRDELNAFEARNINAGINRMHRRGMRYNKILNFSFCIDLHREMTNRTWRWAGEIRNREVNIGNCPPYMVRERLIDRLESTLYWVENSTFEPDEICARLHRDLVWIHPFKNVNGRHSRIMADFLCRSLKQAPFTWGGGQLLNQGTDRIRYLEVLRQADAGDYTSLIEFMRS